MHGNKLLRQSAKICAKVVFDATGIRNSVTNLKVSTQPSLRASKRNPYRRTWALGRHPRV